MKRMPGPVWRLMAAYSLMMAGTSLMVLLHIKMPNLNSLSNL